MDYNSIEVFDYWAKETCPVLFEGRYEPYTHYLKRTGRRYESVRYLARRKEQIAAREPMYETYVYHLEKPRSTTLTASMLERCTLAHWVYNCSRTSGTFTCSRICYYRDTTKGMFLFVFHLRYRSLRCIPISDRRELHDEERISLFQRCFWQTILPDRNWRYFRRYSDYAP